MNNKVEVIQLALKDTSNNKNNEKSNLLKSSRKDPFIQIQDAYKKLRVPFDKSKTKVKLVYHRVNKFTIIYFMISAIFVVLLVKYFTSKENNEDPNEIKYQIISEKLDISRYNLLLIIVNLCSLKDV